MAHTGLHMMTLHVWPQAAAQLLSGERLANRTDIVPLAFDRKQRGMSDRPRVDAPTVPLELAQWQRVLLKHRADGLKVELGRQIHDSQIFVIEFFYRRRFVLVAIGEVAEKIDLGFDMPFEIHAHKSGKLQKTGVDAAQCAGV